MAKKKVSLPREWKKFVNAYGSDLSYWYIPKGLAVTPEALRDRLLVLRGFEGHTREWRDCQEDYINELVTRGISGAKAKWSEGGAPLARMLKQVFVMLGLAWVENDEFVEITDVGNEFLDGTDPDGVLSDQVSRFQFTNPTVRAKDHNGMSLHPVPFLLEVLRTVDGQYISRDEYVLFVSRAKRYDEIDRVIDSIHRYRDLDSEVKAELISQCSKYKLAGMRRDSILNTIRLNASYALKFYSLSENFEIDAAGNLSLVRGKLIDTRKLLNRYNKDGEFIHFADQKDWIAFYGAPGSMATSDVALDYYLDKGDIEAAIRLKKKTETSPKELKSFKDMVVAEKTIEDHLEHDLSLIEKQIGVKLKLVGRQYSTTVGPIDLLAKSNATGEYYVIELKKGRSADRVYGQCSRYMGWVRKNLAKSGKPTHGIIVATKIDDKLKAARDAHDTKVYLIELSLKAGAAAV
ncbi:AlwI family type II restriction endonuclease [Sulfitobacter sabulilitoris]|uniref:AlwI family type II restriction endonuclease n=1 Tax=Sulfitobacter sabulilitoris TaxID=2562655 RepID=A0A5S3PKE1_9RHOB|nr:AlwI family type II restriction endonuclease [Sulfitobacter sabulilitoris]TMM54726.1 AlwI family type II restriction endonuclease [Sulfitobacter sabulilitoris]